MATLWSLSATTSHNINDNFLMHSTIRSYDTIIYNTIGGDLKTSKFKTKPTHCCLICGSKHFFIIAPISKLSLELNSPPLFPSKLRSGGLSSRFNLRENEIHVRK